jgi:glycosyltransferase involved in cell wall biosynthesis
VTSPVARRTLFWSSAWVLAYAYAGFPLIAAVRGVLRPRPVARDASHTPRVSLIVAAYNESAAIADKIENTLALDYPRARLEVIVASDGSTDATNAIAQGYTAAGIRLLALPRRGKNPTLNAAVAAARGDVLVFTDADAMLTADALRHLIAPFADPEVGAVAGERRQADHRESRARRVGWTFRRGLRQLLSRGGSVTAAEGQIHALRRELFRPIPPDGGDDFFISAQAIVAHRRLVYEPRAVSYPLPGSSALCAPFRRKVRQTEHWLQALWNVRGVLNPREHGFYAFQLVSHKLLRRLTFAPLLSMALTAPTLMTRGRVYRMATIAQAGFHGAAVLGLILQDRQVPGRRLLSAPLRFDMPHAAALVAVVELLRGREHSGTSWAPPRPPAPTPPPAASGARPAAVGDEVAWLPL